MSTNPQITNRQGDVIDAPELTLIEVERFLADLRRQPFHDALCLVLRNPTDAVPVVGPDWYPDERFRDALDTCIALRIKNAQHAVDALHKWSNELPPDDQCPNCDGRGVRTRTADRAPSTCGMCGGRGVLVGGPTFCTACQQHRPCSCDDIAGDR